MKEILYSFFNFLEHINNLQVATQFANSGNYEEACNTITKEFKGWI